MEMVNREQLTESLKGVSAEQMRNVVIAYEPVWAIDNKYLNPDTEIRAATIQEANDSHKVVRDWLIETYGEDFANNIPIQYGGSMKPTNAHELLSQENIGGGLIGGASLKAETFIPIVEAAIKQISNV